MNIFSSLTSTTIAVAFFVIGGMPGIVQSQQERSGFDDNELYQEPYPYFESIYDSDDRTFREDDRIWDDARHRDHELREDYLRSLSGSPFVDGEDITVAVNHGIATLAGSVEDRSAMIDVEEIAYDAGAMRVQNQLTIRESDDRPWAEMRDNELKEEIQDELWWSLFVNDDRIRVSVQDGVATLHGTVENKGEIADAVENAYEAGAKRVKSRLWVNPDLK